MGSGRIDFGEFILDLRTNAGYSQKRVADKLCIDISMLSKIEHGERHVQGHMIKPLAEMFKLDYKEIQILYLNQKINDEFGNEPFFRETIKEIASTKDQ
jgi:transcriptional regulator with XRE-family HTH domain